MLIQIRGAHKNKGPSQVTTVIFSDMLQPVSTRHQNLISRRIGVKHAPRDLQPASRHLKESFPMSGNWLKDVVKDHASWTRTRTANSKRTEVSTMKLRNP